MYAHSFGICLWKWFWEVIDILVIYWLLVGCHFVYLGYNDCLPGIAKRHYSKRRSYKNYISNSLNVTTINFHYFVECDYKWALHCTALHDKIKLFSALTEVYLWYSWKGVTIVDVNIVVILGESSLTKFKYEFHFSSLISILFMSILFQFVITNAFLSLPYFNFGENDEVIHDSENVLCFENYVSFSC